MANSDNHIDKPASIVAIGAGNRMHTYMHYILEHPDKACLAAVVEPDETRRNSMADTFHIPATHRFKDYHEFFKSKTVADAAIICTPENTHYEPAMMAIARGMHVLLEKPIAQTLQQCVDIAQAARKAGVIVGICHIMRYHPCSLKVKEIIDTGNLGPIISIRHNESVGIDRNTHSYVRGYMNRTHENNPMILAKCCHDVDFLLWISGARCRRLSSFGSLRWFKSENAPAGSADRCINCSVESKCPFSAIDLYERRHEWINNFIIHPGQTLSDSIQEELHHGPLGRCVYHCDNDVVDNQVVMLDMDDGSTITLSMEIFTQYDCRTTYIRLAKGEIYCSDNIVKVNRFLNHQEEVYKFDNALNNKYHGGADLMIVDHFLQAIKGNPKCMSSLIDDSIESHHICFEAEKSRLSGQTVYLTNEFNN